MPDIAMCNGDGCPFKSECYRHKATPNGGGQSWFTTPPYDDEAGECEYFIQVRKPNG